MGAGWGGGWVRLLIAMCFVSSIPCGAAHGRKEMRRGREGGEGREADGKVDEKSEAARDAGRKKGAPDPDVRKEAVLARAVRMTVSSSWCMRVRVGGRVRVPRLG